MSRAFAQGVGVGAGAVAALLAVLAVLFGLAASRDPFPPPPGVRRG